MKAGYYNNNNKLQYIGMTIWEISKIKESIVSSVTVLSNHKTSEIYLDYFIYDFVEGNDFW